MAGRCGPYQPNDEGKPQKRLRDPRSGTSGKAQVWRRGAYMGFRQNNKRKRDQSLAFQGWLEGNNELIAKAGLPASVTQSRDDWAYFLYFRYHDFGNWNTPPFTGIDFTWDEFSSEQQVAVHILEVRWDEYVRSHPILADRIPAQKSP
jgi:hypothetical protein